MILEIYILLIILGFVLFLIAVFFNESIANLYLWPVSMIIFGTLFFASFNIQTTDTVISFTNTTVIDANTTQTIYGYTEADTLFREIALSWLWLGMSALTIVLFISDIFTFMKNEAPILNPNQQGENG